MNVNTIDEVPDSSWFTNRAGTAAGRQRTRPGARSRRRAGARRLDDRLGKIRRDHAGPDDPRRGGRHLLHQVRSAGAARRWRAPPRSSRRSSSTRSATSCLKTIWPRCAASRSRSAPARSSRTRPGGSARCGRLTSMRSWTGRPQRRRQLPDRRQQAAARHRARPVPLLRHASGRSERHLSARAPPRAARALGLRRVAQSRRVAQRQLARHAGARREPVDHPSPPARFRLDARQRQHEGPEPARRERIRLGSAADAGDDADARPVRPSVDQGGLPRHPGDRPLRGELLPAAGVEAGLPERGVSRDARPKTASGPPASSRRFPTTPSAASWTRRGFPIRAPPITCPKRCWPGRARC